MYTHLYYIPYICLSSWFFLTLHVVFIMLFKIKTGSTCDLPKHHQENNMEQQFSLSMSEKQWFTLIYTTHFSLNIARVSVVLLLKLGHILEHKADVVSIYYLSKLTHGISLRLNP